MKKIIFSILFLSLTPYSLATTPANFEGKYHCHGQDAGDKVPYQCTTEIKKSGVNYVIDSQCDKDHYFGKAIYNVKDRSLAIAFVNTSRAEDAGIIISRVVSPGHLKSAYSYMNKDGIEYSYCALIKA